VWEFVAVDVAARRDADAVPLVLVEGGRAVVDDVHRRSQVSCRLHARAATHVIINAGQGRWK
jgi:hypothetical protein